MTIVLGAADFILRRDDVPAIVRDDVEVMRDAGQRSAGITAQLLAFGRRQILRPEVVDLSKVVAEFESVLRRTLAERYQLRFDLGAGAGRVRADRRQLEQVLLNLALNASDAMPAGGRLLLRTSRVDCKRPIPEFHSSLPFGLVRTSTSRSPTREPGWTSDARADLRAFLYHKGAGKGNRARPLHGVWNRPPERRLHCRAKRGRQRHDVHRVLTVTGEPIATDQSAPEPRSSGGTETVLIVEDQPDVRQMAGRALRAEGYKVVEAVDGQHALDVIASETPQVSLVITDLALPRLDGLELGRELSRILPDVPVLFMTGYTSSESMRRSALMKGIIPGKAIYRRRNRPPRALCARLPQPIAHRLPGQ